MADRFQVAGYGLRVWMYSVGEKKAIYVHRQVTGNPQLITLSCVYSITKSQYPGSYRFLWVDY